MKQPRKRGVQSSMTGKSIRWGFGMICGTSMTRMSWSSGKKDSKDNCSEFNTIYWKMNPKLREQSCNETKGCSYSSENGVCLQNNQKQITRDIDIISTPNKIKSLVVKRDSGDIVVAIEGLMKESFTSSLADSIEKSHEAAHEVAKALVLDVLHDCSNIQHVGTILSHIFTDETVLSSTRALAYFYLHTNVSIGNILWQLNWLRFYYCRGGGKVSSFIFFTLPDPQVYSEIELINQFLLWSQQKEFRDVVYPIVIWSFQQEESVVKPLGEIAGESLKELQVYTSFQSLVI
jgi:hypothetical protein